MAVYGGESMMLGSPLSSPTSPGAHGSAQNPYLPAYLLGEQTPAVTSPVQSSSRLFSGQSSSPPKGSSFSKNTMFASPFASQSAGHTPQRTEPRRDVVNRPKDKPGAPPVTGLLETISSPIPTATDRWGDQSLNTTGRLGQIGSPYQGPQTPGMSGSIFSPDNSQMFAGPKKTPPSPAQVDPFYTQGESIGPDDRLDDTWVTIFGFPPAAASFILQQFSQYGNIQRHIVATDGNWMHVHYQSILQAKKALSKNGKVFGGTIMVGVTPCIDKGVMEQGTTGGDTTISRGCYGTPQTRGGGGGLNQSSLCDRSLNTSMAPHNTSIRPLTAAYRAANSEHEVVPGNHTPQKNGGIINKTMEYVFGW